MPVQKNWRNIMPLELLREIASKDLPLVVENEEKIDKLRVLKAAGMVTAQLPNPGIHGTATVLTITGLGRATLKIQPTRQRQTLPPILLDS
jgi:hypothetical protein